MRCVRYELRFSSYTVFLSLPAGGYGSAPCYHHCSLSCVSPAAAEKGCLCLRFSLFLYHVYHDPRRHRDDHKYPLSFYELAVDCD